MGNGKDGSFRRPYLSDDELRLLQDVAEAMQQGSFTEQMLATDEWAALNKAYNAALDEECRKAEFTSSADFRRLKAG